MNIKIFAYLTIESLEVMLELLYIEHFRIFVVLTVNQRRGGSSGRLGISALDANAAVWSRAKAKPQRAFLYPRYINGNSGFNVWGRRAGFARTHLLKMSLFKHGPSQKHF